MKGWFRECYRHSLAAKGIRTSFARPRIKPVFYLSGGLYEKALVKGKQVKFDPKQLAIGKKVEMEHTTDEKVALEIARDHLTEDPEYYTRLRKMERQSMAGKESVMNPEGLDVKDFIKWYGAFTTGSIDDIAVANKSLPRNGVDGKRTSFGRPMIYHPLKSPPLGELDPLVHIKRIENLSGPQLERAGEMIEELRELKLVEGRKPSLVAAFISASVQHGPDFGREEFANKYGVDPGTLRKYRKEFFDKEREMIEA
jgi:hypothetical protein